MPQLTTLYVHLQKQQDSILFGVLGVCSGALLMSGILQTMHPSTPQRPLTPLVISEARAVDIANTAPTRLKIPSVNIDTLFEGSLTLTETGEVAVPERYDQVGWYEYGPIPGEIGPAVVLGHVDSQSGPAAFYNLGQLHAGDEIFIERADGSTAVFEVTGYEEPSQEEFPTNRVYGDIDHAGLRLITCTGTYDRGVLRYSHNLIVYAELKELKENIE